MEERLLRKSDDETDEKMTEPTTPAAIERMTEPKPTTSATAEKTTVAPITPGKPARRNKKTRRTKEVTQTTGGDQEEDVLADMKKLEMSDGEDAA